MEENFSFRAILTVGINIIFPGSGYILCKDYLKGIKVLIVCCMLYIINGAYIYFFINLLVSKNPLSAIVSALYALIVIWTTYDSFQLAQDISDGFSLADFSVRQHLKIKKGQTVRELGNIKSNYILENRSSHDIRSITVKFENFSASNGYVTSSGAYSAPVSSSQIISSNAKNLKAGESTNIFFTGIDSFFGYHMKEVYGELDDGRHFVKTYSSINNFEIEILALIGVLILGFFLITYVHNIF